MSNSQMSRTQPRAYPSPHVIVVKPSTTHTHTLILLHDRGATAQEFGAHALHPTTSSGKTKPQIFTGMKFVFPSATPRPSTSLAGFPIMQWFDNVSLFDPTEKEQLQLEGLRETAQMVHRIIDAEAKAVGAENVLLGGLSQGCAAALFALLTYRPADGAGTRLGGFLGMSGWLPLRSKIGASAKGLAEKSGKGVSDALVSAVARKLVGMPAGEGKPPRLGGTPIYLGHEKEDETVDVELARQAAKALSALGLDVTLKTYRGDGMENDDMVKFMGKNCGCLSRPKRR